MNTKIFNLIIGTLATTFLACSLSAVEPKVVKGEDYLSLAKKSAIVDGYYVAVIGCDGDNPALADDQHLCYSVRTTGTTNVFWVTVPTNIKYAYEVDLFDTHSNSVSKTWLGRSVGTKFSDFKNGKGYFESPSKPYPIGALTTDNPTFSWHIFFTLNDYFNIKKPGDYNLRIRFQILAPVVEPGTTNEVMKVIRFPAMDFPITKPEEPKTNSPVK